MFVCMYVGMCVCVHLCMCITLFKVCTYTTLILGKSANPHINNPIIFYGYYASSKETPISKTVA